MILNPAWIKQVREELAEDAREGHRPKPFKTCANKAAAFYVLALSDCGFVPKVVNLGAGAKLITTQEQVCPHCGGKGYVR